MAAQVAGRMVRESRVTAGLFAGLRATLASFAHTIGLLWLEITGVFFLFFAFGGSVAAWREYRLHGTTRPAHVAITVGFVLLFAWFGVSSFWRARRKQRVQ